MVNFLEINFEQKKDLKTGTTTVGIIGKDVVVLAADMQATMGNLNYDEESQKLYKITDYIALTNAGNVGDSLVLIRFLRSQAKLYETERDAKMSPKAMATFLSNILNSNRYFPYIVQFILAGNLKKPVLYELTPYGGVIERNKYAVSGSGTMMALTVLDQGYKKDLGEKEAIKLAVKAIMASKKRDIFTGGKSISVMVVEKHKVRELDEKEVEKYIEAEKKSLQQI